MTGIQNSFSKGFRDGVPIGLGYLSVAFAFGMAAMADGLPLWAAVGISMTNVTSAGQVAGLSLIVTGAPLFEMALTQFIINLRYSLMSLSLSQKLSKGVRLLDRFLIAFCNTDEVFAVAMGNEGELGRRYLYGLICAPYLGWVLGTLVGAAASSLLPAAVRSALGIAIYGMFIAIIVPPSRKNRAVLGVVLFSIALSCLFAYVPVLNSVSNGFVIIICAVAASLFGALLFPLKEEVDG